MTRCFTRNDTLSSTNTINEEITLSKRPNLSLVVKLVRILYLIYLILLNCSFTLFLAILEWYFSVLKRLRNSSILIGWITLPGPRNSSIVTRRCLRISASPAGHETSQYSGSPIWWTRRRHFKLRNEDHVLKMLYRVTCFLLNCL